MAYTLKKKLANKKNYGSKRSTKDIKKIVWHYTSNDGDTDEANGNYFANNIVKASAHYFVDDDSVTQSVPDNYIAWAVGGNKYPSCKETGGGKLYGVAKNSNTINIELCDDVKNGKVYPSEKTIENALELTRTLMKKYGLSKDDVIRHFDVTGKLCPAYWCGTKEKDKKWQEILDRLDGKKKTTKKTTTKKESFKPYVVKVTAKTLNVRAGAGTKNKVVGVITDDAKLIKKNPNYYFPKTAYTIVEEKMNGTTKWLKLKSGAGWISSNYTKKC